MPAMRGLLKISLPVVLGVFCFGTLEAMQQIEVNIPGIEEPEILLASGIGADIQVLAIIQADGSIRQKPGRVDTGQLVLTRVFNGSSDFIDWVNQVADAAAGTEGIVYRDIACRQRIGAGTGLHVVYLNAFPAAYDGPDFAPDTVALESLTCVYDAVFTLLAPDPFKLTQINMESGDLLIEWAGVLGDGHIEYADSLDATDEQWSPITPSELLQDGPNGSARIPLSQFAGNRFFFRIEKP